MKDLVLENFTQNQIDAIKSVDSNTLVTASAGSGKTSVLVTRICYILKEKLANLNEILVVTFTNLASLEMKQRVKTDLEELVKADYSYIEQLNKLNTADISTLHKFCQKIIKEYFYETSTDPNFRILEENETFYLMNEALNELIDEEVEKGNSSFISLMKLFNEKRKDVDFKNMCIRVYKFLKSKHNYKEFLQKVVEEVYNKNFSENIIIKYFNEYIDGYVEFFASKFNELILKSKQIECTKLENIFNEYSSYLKVLENKSFEDRFAWIINSASFSDLRLSKPTSEEEELKEEARIVITTFKKDLQNIQNIICDKNKVNIEQKIDACLKYLTTLFEFINKFDDFYYEKKEKLCGLDFNDLEQKCLKTLENQSICEAIKNRYKFIFVDEYQDTNEIQEAILSKVSNGSNMFMVGDVKQSIYFFRECSPQIFINKFNDFNYDETKGKVFALNKNFRSDEQILDFSNFIFSNIMKQETSSVNYEKDAKFAFGEKFKRNNNANYPVVSVKIISKEKKEIVSEEVEEYDIFSAQKVQSENEKLNDEISVIASEIKKLTAEQIFDASINDYRNIEYKDIAILSRKKNSVIKHIVKKLSEQDIPTSTSYSVNIFAPYETKLIINILKLISNYQNDIALASVLTSFMYELSYNDMLSIKNSYNKDFLYESVLNYASEKDDEISFKLNKLLCDLNEFNTLLKVKTKSELVDHIVNKFYFEEHFLNKISGDECLNNINLLKQNIKLFNDISLTEYLNYVNEFAKDKESEVEITTEDNSVKVMTIHASKGLEFPAVFLINSNGEFSVQGYKSKLLTNQKYGFGITTFNSSKKIEEDNIIRNIIKLNSQTQEKQEEMRLLYVALTRAKNHLIVVGSINRKDVLKLSNSFEIMKANSYLKWIMGSMPENTLQNIRNGKNKEIIKLKSGNVNIDIIDNSYQLNNEVLNKKSYGKEFVDKDFEREYVSNEKMENPIMFKNSVTAIMNQEETYNIKDFKYNKQKDADEDFLLIGNMYHLVMELIDFNAIKNNVDVENFLNKLVKENTITNEEKLLINSEKILKACLFFSELINTNNDIVLKEKSFMCYMPASNLINTEFSNKVLVQGIADLVVIKEKEIVLIDYKTTKFKTEEMFTKKYKTQLEIYAKAIEKFYNKPVYKKYIYSFYFDKAIIV